MITIWRFLCTVWFIPIAHPTPKGEKCLPLLHKLFTSKSYKYRLLRSMYMKFYLTKSVQDKNERWYDKFVLYAEPVQNMYRGYC